MDKIINKEFLLRNKDRIIKVTAVIIILAVAFFVFAGKDGNEDEPQVEAASETAQEETAESSASGDAGSAQAAAGQNILVDVSGAVADPQVVELPQGSRVQDAIDAAGGLKKNADISSINRAAEVKDGEKIDIPVKGKNSSYSAGSYPDSASGTGDTQGSDPSSSGSGGLVNINTADSAQLQTLTGIGPALAGRILLYREENGGFSRIEDIKNVSGIGDKTFEKFKDNITI